MTHWLLSLKYSYKLLRNNQIQSYISGFNLTPILDIYLFIFSAVQLQSNYNLKAARKHIFKLKCLNICCSNIMKCFKRNNLMKITYWFLFKCFSCFPLSFCLILRWCIGTCVPSSFTLRKLNLECCMWSDVLLLCCHL